MIKYYCKIYFALFYIPFVVGMEKKSIVKLQEIMYPKVTEHNFMQQKTEDFQEKLQKTTTKMLYTLFFVEQQLKEHQKTNPSNYSEIQLDIKKMEEYQNIFSKGFYFEIAKITTKKLIAQYKECFLFLFNAFKKTIQNTVLYTLDKDDERYVTIDYYKTRNGYGLYETGRNFYQD